MFVVHSFPYIFQCMKRHSREVQARAMWYVSNCDTVCDVLLQDDANWNSKSMVWNSNDSNHIVTVHESNALPFSFMICCWCWWVATHCLHEPESWWVSRFGDKHKCDRGIGSVTMVESLREEEKVPTSATIGIRHLWALKLPPLTYCYLFSMCLVLHANPTHISCCCQSYNIWCRQGKTKTCTHIVGGILLFFVLIYIGAKLSSLLVPTLVLHKVHV